MGRAIACTDSYTSSEVRRFSKRVKKCDAGARTLAIAAMLDDASRREAATIGRMDAAGLGDRFNEQGRSVSSTSLRRGGASKLTNKAGSHRIV
jgi:hypothetical protein